MAKSQRAIVALKPSPAEVGPLFTDVEQVMPYLNTTLSEDLRRIQTLAADLEKFYRDSRTTQQSQSTEWQMFVQDSAIANAALTEDMQLVIAAAEQKSAALATALERANEALASATGKSQILETAIANAKAATDDLVAMRDLVLESHESKWAETQQQLQQDRSNLSQQLSSQISTQVGEIEGANHAWRTQTDTANQTWRKQVEAANQGWQMGQAQQAERWRDETFRDMAQRADTSLRAAHTATERADQLAARLTEEIAKLSQQVSASQQEAESHIAANRTAWEKASRAHEAETALLRQSVQLQQKLLYGAGAAIAVLTLLCIIALIR